ncbi:GNAT family N-acetyltransferase [Kocuria massiliensis]|uniref:GNAT family N-acetyltransferase n=1 Tax=Kocuria massiliensis TaxID=1926282 RepID=UPI00117A7B55|nr:GNAT family protein [Kocuria massiliensis]
MRNVSLVSERLSLDPPCADDVAAIADACQDPEIPRWTGQIPHPYDEDDAMEFIEGIVGPGWARGDCLNWAVHLRDVGFRPNDGTLMEIPKKAADQAPGDENLGLFSGIVSLNLSGTGGASIGYWTAKGARNQGITQEACELVLDFAFRSASERSHPGLGVHRVEWRAMVGNVASAKLAQRVGFSYEGLLRSALTTIDGRRMDVWVAGLLAEDSRAVNEWPDHVFRPA